MSPRMPRRKTLLIGNGINRLNGLGTSWAEVLSASAEFVGNPRIMANWELKPLPLLYEALYSEHVVKNGKKEFELKETVAHQVAQIVSNDFHRKVIKAGMRNVITTNYDLTLEKSSEEKWKKASLRRETKYSVFRRNQVDKTNIWHMHGTSDAPNTIQLGHEHYSGQLQHLRNLVIKIGSKSSTNPKSAFLQGEHDFDDTNTEHSWLDVFFRDDVHIIGLGMAFSEIDLWWAIAYKNRLKSGKAKSLKSKLGIELTLGSTTYHELEQTVEDPRAKARQEVLNSLGVKIKLHPNEGSYEGMFDEVIKLASRAN